MNDAVLTALLATGAAALSALLSFVATRRREGGQHSLSERSVFTEEQVAFRQELRDEVNRLREQVDALEIDVRRMRKIIDTLEEEIDSYRAILREHGIPLPARMPYWRYPNDATAIVTAPPGPNASSDTRGPNDARGIGDTRAPNDPRRAEDVRRPNDLRWSDDARRPNDLRRPDDALRPNDLPRPGDEPARGDLPREEAP